MVKNICYKCGEELKGIQNLDDESYSFKCFNAECEDYGIEFSENDFISLPLWLREKVIELEVRIATLEGELGISTELKS